MDTVAFHVRQRFVLVTGEAEYLGSRKRRLPSTSAERSAPVDLSVVLTVHDDAIDLLRTLRSTKEAARYARHLDTRVELVIVLDRPTPEVVEFVDGIDPSEFDAAQRVLVDHGSPGPSRNAGIRAASGTFVALCDADDLISFNGFAAAMETLRESPDRTVVVPEYVFVFGDYFAISRYSPSGRTTPLQMVSSHQYTARIVAPRDLLLEVPNADVPPGPGHAYEDWHLNCDLLAAGARFMVAPNSILFYRRRARSVSSGSQQISTRQIPASRLFEPEVFLRLTAPTPPALNEPSRSRAVESDDGERRFGFARGALCRELVHAANQIDPAIRSTRFDGVPWVDLVDSPTRAGLAYRRFCELAPTGGAQFADVVLASAEAGTCGAEHICGILRLLAELDPGARTLVLAEGPEDLAPWLDFLPAGSLALALRELHPEITVGEMDTVALKAIQATAVGARVHLGRSAFGARFWRAFGVALPESRGVLHRIGVDHEIVDGRMYIVDDDVALISACLHTIHAVLAADGDIRDADHRRFGTEEHKWSVLDTSGEFMSASTSMSELERIFHGDGC